MVCIKCLQIVILRACGLRQDCRHVCFEHLSALSVAAKMTHAECATHGGSAAGKGAGENVVNEDALASERQKYVEERIEQ